MSLKRKKLARLIGYAAIFSLVFLGCFNSSSAATVNILANVPGDGGSIPLVEVCTETCGNWGLCVNGLQTRSCVNAGGICNATRVDSQTCCVPATTCADNLCAWSSLACIGEIKTCSCSNGCGGTVTVTQSCSCAKNCPSWQDLACVKTGDEYLQTCSYADNCNNLVSQTRTCVVGCNPVVTQCPDWNAVSCVCSGQSCFKTCTFSDGCPGHATITQTQSCSGGSGNVTEPGSIGGGSSSGGGGGGGGFVISTSTVQIIKEIPEQIIQNIVQTIPQPIQEVAKSITRTPIVKIVEQKQVQQVNKQIVAPVSVAVTTVVATSAFSFVDLLTLLRLFFTEPFYLLFGRRRKNLGTVYNAYTKRPIDLATIRLFSAEDKKLVATRVTNNRGQYYLLVEPGKYYLEITKDNFEFPSKVLSGRNADEKFIDLYTGGTIEATEDKALLNANIPLDPNIVDKSDKQIIRTHKVKRLRGLLVSVGPLAAVISFIISPSWLLFGLVCLHFVLYYLFTRLAVEASPKNWGLIYDKTDKAPLSSAVARIYDPAFHKLLETQVTDGQGRYGFLASNNIYYITAQKEGYQPYRSEHLNLQDKEAPVVKVDVGLEKTGESNNRQIDQIDLKDRQNDLPPLKLAEPVETDLVIEDPKLASQSESLPPPEASHQQSNGSSFVLPNPPLPPTIKDSADSPTTEEENNSFKEGNQA